MGQVTKIWDVSVKIKAAFESNPTNYMNVLPWKTLIIIIKSYSGEKEKLNSAVARNVSSNEYFPRFKMLRSLLITLHLQIVILSSPKISQIITTGPVTHQWKALCTTKQLTFWWVWSGECECLYQWTQCFMENVGAWVGKSLSACFCCVS